MSALTRVAAAGSVRDWWSRGSTWSGSLRVTLPVGLIALAAAAAWPAIYPNNYYANVGVVALFYVLLGLGMDLLLGYGGLLHAGFAAFYGAGAYLMAYLLIHWGVSFWAILPLCVLTAAVLAFVIGVPGLRVSGLYFVLVTLAAGELFTITTGNVKALGSANGLFGLPPASVFGHQVLTERSFYWMVLPVAVLCLILVRALATSRLGLAWNCGRIDEIAANALGINVFRGRLQITVIAGALAGLAGGFFAIHQSAVSPDSFSFNQSITVVLLVALGGMRSVPGLLLGVGLIAVLPEALRSFKDYSLFAYGIAIAALIQVRPNGLMARRERFARPALVPPAARSGACVVTPARVETLRLTGITKHFGGVHAASDVSLEVAPHEIVGLIGPNGAGKTTILNMIGGQLRPDSGALHWGDIELSRLGAHRRARIGIARTFQTPRLFPELSILDNLVSAMEPSWRIGLGRTVARSAAARREWKSALVHAVETLTAVEPELVERLNDHVGGLPYGLLRKLEIARALMSRPGLLVLDEPAAGLNAVETAEVGELLMKLSVEGMAVLLVEHDMDLVMSVTNRLIVLDYGKVIAAGTPEEIRHNPTVIDSYLGVDDDEIDQLVRQ
jgi:branched-chain amino acid transport system permease protein